MHNNTHINNNSGTWRSGSAAAALNSATTSASHVTTLWPLKTMVEWAGSATPRGACSLRMAFNRAAVKDESLATTRTGEEHRGSKVWNPLWRPLWTQKQVHRQVQVQCVHARGRSLASRSKPAKQRSLQGSK